MLDQLPELQDCGPLREFVSKVNGESSIFQTFGCEKWLQPWQHDKFPGFGRRMGSYVDLAFADIGRSQDRGNYTALIERYEALGQSQRIYDTVQVGFEFRPTVATGGGGQTWWTLGWWNYGVGRTDEEAHKWWSVGVKLFQDFLLSQR